MGKHTWTYDHRIKWDKATILAIDGHKFSRKMRESIEIEKHNTIDQEGKPLDSTWRALFNSELKQVTFLTTRTPTGSKVDVFHQSQSLTQSSDVTHAVRVVKNVTCLSSLMCKINFSCLGCARVN